MDDLVQAVGNAARLAVDEVTKVAHDYQPACAVLGTTDRSVNALSARNAQAGMTRPMQVREDEVPYEETVDGEKT